MPNTNLVGAGTNAGIQQQVDKTHQAARVSIRPPEVGIYGSYAKALKSGVIAAGMTGPLPVWEFRWGRSDVLGIIRSLRIQASVSTTAFNATAADSSFSLYRAQGFTAMDTTNGTLAAYTKSKAGALGTMFTASSFAADATATRTGNGGIVILNTSASGLTGGTRTNDDDPIKITSNRIVASAAAETIITPEPAPYMIDPDRGPALTPHIFDANEGLVLMADAITATGTWRLIVEVEWDEIKRETWLS